MVPKYTVSNDETVGLLLALVFPRFCGSSTDLRIITARERCVVVLLVSVCRIFPLAIRARRNREPIHPSILPFGIFNYFRAKKMRKSAELLAACSHLCVLMAAVKMTNHFVCRKPWRRWRPSLVANEVTNGQRGFLMLRTEKCTAIYRVK